MITSRLNPEVKIARSLQYRKHRREQGLFLIEGKKFLTDLLRSGLGVNRVFYCRDSLDEAGQRLLADLANAAAKTGGRLIEVSADVLEHLSATKTPQGIAAVAHLPDNSLEKLPQEDRPLFVVFDRLQDPGNVGALIRTAAAAGVSGAFLLKGTADPYSPKAFRASAGTVLRLPVVQELSHEMVLRYLQTIGAQVVACLASGEVPYHQFDYRPTTALIVGNEGAGVSQTLQHQSIRTVTIPMANQVESLNAAVAGALVLYKAAEQRWIGGQR